MEEKQILLHNIATLRMVHANLQSFVLEISNEDTSTEYHEAIMTIETTIQRTEQILKEMKG